MRTLLLPLLCLCLLAMASPVIAQDEEDDDVDAFLRIPTGPLLDAKQLERAKWYYSIDEAVREPEKVVKLSLSGDKLKQFPDDVLRFPNLQILNLSDNKLKTLPDEISDLENLQVLILTGNRLQALPEGMRLLNNLTHLYLSGNNLVIMPAWIGGLAKLRYVDLTYNNLIAPDLGRLQARLPKAEIVY